MKKITPDSIVVKFTYIHWAWNLFDGHKLDISGKLGSKNEAASYSSSWEPLMNI